MDEFQEARWLQRYGTVNRAMHFVLVALLIAAAAVLLYKEVRRA